jgi:hypothetical protein
MAAREHEREAFVRDRAHVVLVFGKLLEPGEELRLLAVHAVTANAIDRAVACGGDDPRTRVPGVAVPRPALERGRERVLDGVLGELEVSERSREDADRIPPLLAKNLLDAGQ